MFLLFLDNLAVVFFNYKTLQNKHNIRTFSGNIKIVRNSFSEWVSERLLFNAISAIFQLYHGESKLIFNEMMPISSVFNIFLHSAHV